MIVATSMASLGASKALRPVSISKSTDPNANKSVRVSASFPSSCSGAMYWAVPRITPGRVRSDAVRSSAERDTVRGLGQSKVEELGAGPGHHDVAWFEIAMHDPGTVRAIQRRGNL